MKNGIKCSRNSSPPLAKPQNFRSLIEPPRVYRRVKFSKDKPYYEEAKAAGLNIISWSLERSGPLAGGGGWYFQSVNNAIGSDGDYLRVLDVLAQDVGIVGMFSD